MDSQSNPGRGEKRRNDDDSTDEPQSSPSKKQKGVEGQEKTLADVIKADGETILKSLTRARAKGKPVYLFFEESRSTQPICRARFCIPKEIRRRKFIESSYHFKFREGHPWYYHISCLEQMFDLTELRKLAQLGDLKLQPLNALDPLEPFPSQIEEWYARLSSKQPSHFLSKVLAKMFNEQHIDCSSLEFLRYLRESEDGEMGTLVIESDDRTEGLPKQPLKQLTLSQFKSRLNSLITHPDYKALFTSALTPSEKRVSMGLTVRQVIEASSQDTALEMGGVPIGDEDVPDEEDISEEDDTSSEKDISGEEENV